MPLPSVFQGVQDCRLPGLKPPKPSRRPFSGGSRLPFARPQTLQTLPQASKATTLTATCPCICFSGGSRLPFARPQTPQTLPQASKATTLTATCPCHLFFRGFKTAVCPASNPPNPPAGLFQGVQDCRLPGLKPSKPFRRPPRQQLLQLHAPAICFSGVQDCRLPGLKPPKPFRRPPRQQLLQLHAPAVCFSGGSRLPFARPQTPQTLPQASKATTLTATCPCHLFFRGFKTAVCPASNSYMPLPSVFQGVQDCRLPGLKRSKPFRRPPRQQLLQLHAPAICFSGGSRLPFARPQTLQTLPQASKATTLTATCPCHLFFRGFKAAVCPASNPPNPSAGLQGNNSYTCHLFFRGFKTAVCPASNAPNPSAGLQGNNSYSYMPLPSVFRGFKTAVCPASNPPNPSAGLFQGVQDCRLPGLKPSKPFRRPPRQQLLQLHAPAICFSGGSRLPFARPQTPQTLPQASKATTLTATCPCHLFFRGFKGRANGSLEPPEKQMAGACSCKSCCLGGLRKGLEGLRPGKRQS